LAVPGPLGLGRSLAAAPEAGDVGEYGLLLALDVVAADEQPLEDDLVHQASEHGACFQVDLVAASHDGQGIIKGIQHVSGFVACGFDEALGLGELALDAGLLGLQEPPQIRRLCS
jgi:hypothetical protein